MGRLCMNLNYRDIGTRIQMARKRKGLTQEQITEMVGLSASHYSNIETAKTKLSLPAIVALANALQVSVDELLCDSLVAGRALIENEVSLILQDCTQPEVAVIMKTLRILKESLCDMRSVDADEL